MTPKEIKKYIRYIADWRLGQLGFAPIYMVDEHPLPWLAPLLNGVEHANFFETRATEYSKAATRGDWNERVGQFRPAAEGEGGAAANDGAGAAGEAGRICSRRRGWRRSSWPLMFEKLDGYDLVANLVPGAALTYALHFSGFPLSATHLVHDRCHIS